MAKITKATKKLLELKKRIRCVCGGTSASKTYSILMILIDYAQSNENKKIDVMSESYPHLENGAIKDFKEIMIDREYWKDDRWNESKHQYTFETNSVIKFISVDKIGKSRGPRRDVLFVNEANNIDYNIVDQLMVRTKEIIWMDWNPTHEFWYYTEIKDHRDHDFITLTYQDCIDALNQNIIDDIESHKGNKNWWKVYGLGQLGELEGMIYPIWRIINEVPHEARLERRWLDFGYSNNESAIGDIYYYNGGWIFDEQLYRKGMSNKMLANFLNALEKPETTIVADSAEPKSINELRSYGLTVVPCLKGKDSVNSGIQLVQDQPISVTKRSLNIIKERRNYMWMTDKNGKIINEEDPACANHHMSGIRYGLSTLGRLKQEVSYWDRVFAPELKPPSKLRFNKGK